MADARPSPEPIQGAKLWPFSLAAYHFLGAKGLAPKNTELLYGLIYWKVSKVPYHSYLTRALYEIVDASIPESMHLRQEQPITCRDSEPEPAFAVVAGDPDDYMHDHPASAELVVEICVTNHEYNRAKLRAYASAGVKECWLVLGPEKQVEVFRKPINGQFTEHDLHGPDGIVISAVLPALKLDLAELFAK